MWLISAGCLLIWCLSVLDCASGVAITTAECGSGATVGQPYVLTCRITGTIANGISWFRENDGSSIITCSQGRNCLSNNPALYSVTTPHPTDKQQFTILSVSSDDIGKSWKCLDGSSLTSVSGCILAQEATTTPPVTSTAASTVITGSTGGTGSTGSTGGSQSSVINNGTSDSETTTTTTVGNRSPGSEGLSGGEIAGIVIGVLVVIAIVVIVVVIIKKKNENEK